MSLLVSHILHDELLQAIEVLGIDKTIKALKEAKSNTLLEKDNKIDYILDTVAEVTGVTKDRILNGSDRTDERKIAVALCVFFVKSKLVYSYAEIKKIFNKHESALSRYHSMIEKIPENIRTDFDKKLLECYNKVKIKFPEKNSKK